MLKHRTSRSYAHNSQEKSYKISHPRQHRIYTQVENRAIANCQKQQSLMINRERNLAHRQEMTIYKHKRIDATSAAAQQQLNRPRELHRAAGSESSEGFNGQQSPVHSRRRQPRDVRDVLVMWVYDLAEANRHDYSLCIQGNWHFTVLCKN
jgi:Fe-S cluster biosynthesis and repair protein YggX